jgi:hypothetical protein
MKNRIKLFENKIDKAINESIKKFILETTLNYDDDNFSGRYDKKRGIDDYIDDEGYLDDPNNPPNDENEDESWIGNKDKENEYSLYYFDNLRPVSYGLNKGYKNYKGGIERDIDDAIRKRRDDLYWTDYGNHASEITRGRANMNGWIKGYGDVDDLGDSWEVFKEMHPHYKFTESRNKNSAKYRVN